MKTEGQGKLELKDFIFDQLLPFTFQFSNNNLGPHFFPHGGVLILCLCLSILSLWITTAEQTTYNHTYYQQQPVLSIVNYALDTENLYPSLDDSHASLFDCYGRNKQD
ncbi:hypothetical protein ACJX0J_028367, partial [Zea mays]